MLRRLPATALFVLGLLVVMSACLPSAEAAVSTKKAIWGPIERGGMPQFPIYADLGVGIYQYMLSWNAVAGSRPATPQDPADPAYAWPPELDRAVAEGARYGIEVSLMVTGSPPWANGRRRAAVP